ncbi:MAG TPA: rRNA adenine dimethyltransferase family protein, partial [bacterium]|nr:rRNA adenine dimethyltransferase family protein [bacterium]
MPATNFPPPRKAWGQHFLTNPSVAEAIVAAVPAAPGDTILEIGPGRGALTRPLLRRHAHLIVVEFDPLLVPHWQATAGVECVAGDILDVGPRLIAARGPLHLVGNLPYNLSSPILALCNREAAHLRSLTIMLQKEFAQRLLAAPGSKEYSALSVVAQCVWHW